jgi:hypothetical protein
MADALPVRRPKATIAENSDLYSLLMLIIFLSLLNCYDDEFTSPSFFI